MECIYNLIRGNHFESANFAIANSKGSLDANEMLSTAKEAMGAVRSEIGTIREKVVAKQKSQAIKMTPPFTWY